MSHVLGQFRIETAIGSGGMAFVFEGRHLGTDTPVAIKVMTSKRSRESRFRRSFLREVRSTARLHHPRIVRVFDVGEVPPELEDAFEGRLKAGAPYLVMEYVEGGALDEYAERLTWPVVRRLVLELLDALAHAHALGVIHRDLKPANVLMDRSTGTWTPKLTDFGIARTFDPEHPTDPSDEERRISGTPKYMAPERVMGHWRDQGPWTDLYALGVMVWRLVTGDSPYSGTTQQVLFAQVQDPLPRFEPVMEIPERLEMWLVGMLAKSPHERFQRAADAAVAFRDVCDSPMIPGTGRRAPSEESLTEEATALSDSISAETDLPTLTTVLEGRPDRRPHRQHGLLAKWPRPPVPADWRRATTEVRPYRRVVGAGLGLFGLRTIPMVDRDDERDALWAGLTDVIRSHGPGVAVVRGPAGTGKTRLVEWLTRRAEEVGAAAVVRVLHSEAGGPADGLGGALVRAFRCEGLGAEERLERTRDRLRELGHPSNGADRDEPETVEVVTGTSESGSSQTVRLPGGSPALTTYDAETLVQVMYSSSSDPRRSVEFTSPRERWLAIRRWLERVALERTPILWIEDAHLAVDAVRFVRWLAEEEPPEFPVFAVLSLRTEGPFITDSVREDIERLSEAATVVSLGRLGEDDLRTLVRRALGLSPTLGDEVVRRAEGSPAFALQIVNDWVDAGALAPGEHGFVLREGTAEVPDDVHALWLRRLNRVVEQFGGKKGAAFDALLLAATLGRWVDHEEWAHCYRDLEGLRDAAGGDLLGALVDQLVTLGLADRRRGAWGFAHGMMRESLQRAARGAGRWQRLNQVCAKSLAELYHPDPAPPVGVRIATHLHQSGDDVAALDVVLEAIRSAKSSHDYDWIERLLAEAEPIIESLALDERDARRGQLGIARARVLTGRNQLVRARAVTERVLEEATEHGWAHTRAEATFQLAGIALSAGRTGRAVELFDRARPLFESLGETHNLARAVEGIGYALLHQGKWEEARQHVDRAGELYEETEDPRGQAYNWYHRGIIERYAGDLDAARAAYEEAAKLAGRLGFRDTLANALNSLGDLDRHDGELEAAQEFYREAYDLWAAVGSAAANIASINLAITLLQQSRWEEARATFVPLAERLQRDNAGMQLTFALAGLLPIHAAAGETEEFDRILERFDAYYATYEIHDPDLTLLRDMTVELWRAAGDEERAEATLTVFGD